MSCIETRRWTAGRTYLMTIMICIMLWLSAGMLARCALAQEQPEPAGPEDINYSMDPAQDFQIMERGSTTWKTVPVTVDGVEVRPETNRAHIYVVWTGTPHGWYVPVGDGTDRCIKIIVQDTEFGSTFLYRCQARIRRLEADGTFLGPPSPFSVTSWYVIRLPGVLRPFLEG